MPSSTRSSARGRRSRRRRGTGASSSSRATDAHHPSYPSSAQAPQGSQHRAGQVNGTLGVTQITNVRTTHADTLTVPVAPGGPMTSTDNTSIVDDHRPNVRSDHRVEEQQPRTPYVQINRGPVAEPSSTAPPSQPAPPAANDIQLEYPQHLRNGTIVRQANDDASLLLSYMGDWANETQDNDDRPNGT